MPATTMRCGAAKPAPEPNQTAAMASSAPAAAPQATGSRPGHTMAVATAPAEAPAVRPITSGLPSGLRVTLWNNAPDRPSAAPAPSAASARGSRRV